MSLFRIIFEEFVGMFVDDGSLALLALVLIAILAVAVKVLGLSPQWGAGLLLAGCPAVLAESLRRAARRRD